VDADGVSQRIAADRTATVAWPSAKGSLPPFCSSTLEVLPERPLMQEFLKLSCVAHSLAFSRVERAALAGFDAEFRRCADQARGGDVEAFIRSAAGVALARAATIALAPFGAATDAEPAAGSAGG